MKKNVLALRKLSHKNSVNPDPLGLSSLLSGVCCIEEPTKRAG